MRIVDRRELVTVVTDVEFTFEDGSIEIVSVSHFQPKDEEEILNNIQNRFISEQNNRNNTI